VLKNGWTLQFMEAIILQGVSTLNFLTSTREAPSGLSVANLQKNVFVEPPKPVSHVLNAAFFEVLDAVYKNHLYNLRESFGLSKSSHRDREKWAKGMEAYWTELVREVQKWTVHRKSEIRTLRTNAIDQAPIEIVLDRMRNNLLWITKGLFNSNLFGMSFPTPAPLLSPMFLLDVSESVIALKPWLELTWKWIDPYAMSSSANQLSYGTTFALQDALDRFKPSIDTQQLVWTIASEIFCMRTDALVALRNADAAAKTTPQPPKFSALPIFNDKDKPKVLADLVEAALKDWRARSTQDVITSRGLRRRDLPDHARNNLLTIGDRGVLINALACTYFPWADCPPNQIKGRLVAAAQRALQALWLSNHQEATYYEIDAYWVLREAIFKILSTKTKTFKEWWDMADYPFEGAPQMPASSQGPDAISTRGQLSAQSKANAIQSGTEKAIQAIIKVLCTEEVGAIPVPVDEKKSDYRPFEEVHEAAMALFEAMAVASLRAQSVYTDPSQERLSIISKKQRADFLAKFDVPTSFEPAPFDVIETYYASFDADQLSNLDVFGPGSLAFEKRQKLVMATKKKVPKSASRVNNEEEESSRSITVVSDLGTVLVKDTPERSSALVKQGEGAVFSSPIIEDDLRFKASIISEFDFDEDEDIYEKSDRE
jgi:hypothetical protein